MSFPSLSVSFLDLVLSNVRVPVRGVLRECVHISNVQGDREILLSVGMPSALGGRDIRVPLTGTACELWSHPVVSGDDQICFIPGVGEAPTPPHEAQGTVLMSPMHDALPDRTETAILTLRKYLKSSFHFSNMSSLKNAVNRRAHKERAQPQTRKKFGLLEKHKDYVLRAQAFHKKEETLRKLKEKAAFRNPDEFYFGMIKSKVIDGVHRPASDAKQYTQEELMLMKTQDIGYLLQKIQSEKKKVERLRSTLHTLDNEPENKHVYFAEDREEAKEVQRRSSERKKLPTSEELSDKVKRKTATSYRELEARKKRLNDLEKLYSDMTLQKELQKKGRKRKLREDEIVTPTAKPVYKWRGERKR
ncbi:hypothetical protein H6P81_013522 [Aristolochia fimbriata]|uniref:U3 small nucleolar RNA-associated protein 11 n=1 Tax=Aristolochia fimbriata TaxID=158543 RepID=A0AAV7EFC4_ARIFI|nr:hypothetical protein H6P81_013522 [Aristolochia fimbriata]